MKKGLSCRRRSLMVLVLFVFVLCSSGLSGCATTGSSEMSREAELPRLEGRSLKESAEVPLLDSPTLGDPDAEVVIVEFLSFPCRDCAVPAEAVATLLEEQGDRVQLVFKHQPREDRPESWILARGLEAAREMGAFWEMRALMLERSGAVTSGGARAFVFELAGELNLDEQQFRRGFESLENTGRIERDQGLARDLGLRTSPTYFVNGESLIGPRRLRHFQEAVAAAVAYGEELATRGVAEEEIYEQSVSHFRALAKENQIPEEGQVEVVDVDTSRLAVFLSEEDLMYGEEEEFLVTVVEFSSLQCPFGAEGSETMEELARLYGEELRFVFKHFPQDQHPESEDAAAAVVAAQRQGAGVEMLRAIYARQSRLSEAGFLEELAAHYELNQEQFRAVLADRRVRDRIWDDRDEGLALGVRNTPEFFINGVRVAGAHPLEYFQAIIDEEIARALQVQQERQLNGDDLYRVLLQREVKSSAEPTLDGD